MTVTGIITALIVGLIIGLVGRAVAPGRQNIPLWLTMLVGIAAALIGTAIVGPMSDTEGFDWIELAVQVVLAAVGVSIVAAMRGGRRSRGTLRA